MSYKAVNERCRRNPFRSVSCCACLILVVIGGADLAQADVNASWNANSDGNWSDGSKGARLRAEADLEHEVGSRIFVAASLPTPRVQGCGETKIGVGTVFAKATPVKSEDATAAMLSERR